MSKGQDRSYRSLRGLERTASTSRVLNLAALLARNVGNEQHVAAPFFIAESLQGAVIVRHRLRRQEQSEFDRHRFSATKLIIPFAREDLGLGGRSVLVGQHNWLDALEEMRGSAPHFQRDAALLQAIDELPSLDPFLLREHLKRRDFDISPTYYDISGPDLVRMQRFVGTEIAKLIELAYRNTEGMESNVNRLVEALLVSKSDERLEPLRLTLRLEKDNYQEGIFAWKGFLYYKWVLNTLWGQLKDVFAELNRVRVTSNVDVMTRVEIDAIKRQLRTKLERHVRMLRQQLKVYDDVFAELTAGGNAVAFRDFLLKSPAIFLSLGEGCGLVSHIATYWRFQFPMGRPLIINGDDLLDTLQDFDSSLGDDEVVQLA